MKKYINIFILVIILSLTLIPTEGFLLAQVPPVEAPPTTVAPTDLPGPYITASNRLSTVGQNAGFGSTSFPVVIGNIIKGILSLIGILFLSYMIYAGYLWLTASGDEEKIKKAKRIISGSIIGFVVTISAYAITAFVVSRFTTTGVYTDSTTQINP